MDDLNLNIAKKNYKIRLWTPGMSLEEPRYETYVGVDTETEELIPGASIIPVLLQVCYPSQLLVHLVVAEHMSTYINLMLKTNPKLELIFCNAPFDLNVLNMSKEPLLRKSLEDNNITDISLRYILAALEAGVYMNIYNLEHISRDLLGIDLNKDSKVRLTFKADTEIDEAHALYASSDAIATAMIRGVMPVK